MGDPDTTTPGLERWPAAGDPDRPLGAVLALHGGRVRGHRPVGRLDLPYLRMRCLARTVHDAVAPHGIEVWTLRFSVQGWNGDAASPVPDARRALAHIAATSGVPVVLLGHSMGARTALRVAAEPDVVGVVALAPWIPSGERMADLTGRRLLIAHGTLDHTTDPRASRNYAAQAWGVATDVQHVDVTGDGHAMLRRPRTWDRIASDGVLGMLGIAAEEAA